MNTDPVSPQRGGSATLHDWSDFPACFKNPPACARTNLIFFRRLAAITLSHPSAKPSGMFFFLFCSFLERLRSSLTCFDVKLKALRYGLESAVRCGLFFSALARFSRDHLLDAASPCPVIAGWVQGKIFMDPDKSLCKSVCVCVCTLAPLLAAFTMETTDGWIRMTMADIIIQMVPVADGEAQWRSCRTQINHLTQSSGFYLFILYLFFFFLTSRSWAASSCFRGGS